jgi:hypothetical protein
MCLELLAQSCTPRGNFELYRYKTSYFIEWDKYPTRDEITIDLKITSNVLEEFSGHSCLPKEAVDLIKSIGVDVL